MTTAGRRAAPSGLGLAVGGLIALYALAYLLWYSATPLGLYPVLDGREQLALAGAIARGELPHEPFYRAPLYPALLAWVIKFGVVEPHLALVVRQARRLGWGALAAGLRRGGGGAAAGDKLAGG